MNQVVPTIPVLLQLKEKRQQVVLFLVVKEEEVYLDLNESKL